MTEQESAELIAQGYKEVLYVEVNCTCGEWRLGLSPTESPYCPCGGNSWTAQQIGHGFTKRALPFAEKQKSTLDYASAVSAVTWRDSTVAHGLHPSRIPIIRLWL